MSKELIEAVKRIMPPEDTPEREDYAYREACLDCIALIEQHAAPSEDVVELERRLQRAEWFIAKEGYRKCDIDACNCPYWHGGSAGERLKEIDETLREAGIGWQGTILETLKAALSAQPVMGEPSNGVLHHQKDAEAHGAEGVATPSPATTEAQPAEHVDAGIEQKRQSEDSIMELAQVLWEAQGAPYKGKSLLNAPMAFQLQFNEMAMAALTRTNQKGTGHDAACNT
jgi:hypothetical protein